MDDREPVKIEIGGNFISVLTIIYGALYRLPKSCNWVSECNNEITIFIANINCRLKIHFIPDSSTVKSVELFPNFTDPTDPEQIRVWRNFYQYIIDSFNIIYSFNRELEKSPEFHITGVEEIPILHITKSSEDHLISVVESFLQLLKSVCPLTIKYKNDPDKVKENNMIIENIVDNIYACLTYTYDSKKDLCDSEEKLSGSEEDLCGSEEDLRGSKKDLYICGSKKYLKNAMRRLRIEKGIESSDEEIMRDRNQFCVNLIKKNRLIIQILAFFTILDNELVHDTLRTKARNLLEYVRIHATL
jgi:hypothetical protein